MSLETWKQEFYPTGAFMVEKADAIAHSLQKWRGARPEALEKHGGRRLASNALLFEDDPVFRFNGTTCALCVHHFLVDKNTPTCSTCPLFKVRGVPCDAATEARSRSPYARWTISNDPEPMIQLLEEALAEQIARP